MPITPTQMVKMVRSTQVKTERTTCETDKRLLSSYKIKFKTNDEQQQTEKLKLQTKIHKKN